MSEDLPNQTTAGSHVFVSYASQDAAVANSIVGSLETHGLKCWMAPRDVKPGAQYADEIVGAINDAKVVVVVLSEHAIASPHVGKEIERASSKRRRIIALRTDNAQLTRAFEYFLSESQWIHVPALGMPAALNKLAEAVAHGVTSSAEPVPASTQPVGHRKTPKPVVIAAAVVISLGAAVGLGFYVWRSNQSAAQAPAVPAITDKSIAVLPFVDMSEKKDQEYFSDGLAEELLDLLAQVPNLKVPARTSSFSFKGRSNTVPEIAKILGVHHVLEGSVRKSGAEVRVTVQLIRADTGYFLWSKTYDRDLKDIFKVQDEIANAVVEALKIQLIPTQSFVNARQTTSSEAHDLFLLGRQRYNTGTPDSDREAIGLFRRAIALDSNYAAAYAALAQTEHNLTTNLGVNPTQGQFTEWTGLLDRAIALAPQLSDGYAIRGIDRLHAGDWAGARADLEKAVELEPHDSRNLRYLARYHASQGELTQARDIASRAIDADPLDPYSLAWRADFKMAIGDYSGARSDLERAFSISSTNVKVLSGRVAVDILEHKLDTALEHARALPVAAERALANAAVLCARGERQAGLTAISAGYSKTQGNFAGADGGYALCGENDKALSILETETGRTYDGMESLKYDPFLVPLRNEPRFHALQKKLNLPAD
jgi:TolB-like protein/tetratricopeptide (TPR) repeat protein